MSSPVSPLAYLKGLGPAKAELLGKELGLYNFADLLEYYPFRYLDRTAWQKIAAIEPDMPFVQVKAKLVRKELFAGKGPRRLKAWVSDETGTLELVFFQSVTFIDKSLKLNESYVVFGKPALFGDSLNMVHPEMETLQEHQASLSAFMQPVYSSTEKLKKAYLDSKGILRLCRQVLAFPHLSIPETLPDYILQRFRIIGKEQAVRSIHFPRNQADLKNALDRLKFEELFFIQLKMLRIKQNRTFKSQGFLFPRIGEFFNDFFRHRLSFELTNAQKRVLKEIRHDCVSGHQMNRLLQGDVGSGKTIVALMSMLMALDNGFQACLMAPTEILARQHYNSLSEMLGPDFPGGIGLLTGSVKQKEVTAVLKRLAAGELRIIIGTHSLIEDRVIFQNLGIVIIDEQHRFGVEQRSRLWKKNTIPPHMLVMTATPIPRTLAMTLYGDLDISVIDELPKGRKPIQTLHYFESKRLRLVGFMKEQIALGRQIYIVYPLIEESATLDYLNLLQGFEQIERSFPKPEFQISIVHGKLKPAVKEFEMQRFVRGETQIMVATTVIEVGVNIPNASVMVIESAERFGLSTLHQLRGRVGRGSSQSYCILMSGNKLSADSKLRIQTMVRTHDGFEIAETDLRLRGPGNLEGTQQSGVLDLKLADLAADQPILQAARTCVLEILEKDPMLRLEENFRLHEFFNHKEHSHISWEQIS